MDTIHFLSARLQRSIIIACSRAAVRKEGRACDRALMADACTYKAASILSSEYGIDVSEDTVSRLMEDLGYSKQLNQKTMQLGEQHPDRNKQFEFINRQAKSFLDGGIPVISVDCKKKENIGNFKNVGGEYRPVKNPRKVLDHDFPLPELGKVSPYGIYSLNDNTRFVNLGTSKETAEFAVQSIRLWWKHIGKNRFQKLNNYTLPVMAAAVTVPG